MEINYAAYLDSTDHAATKSLDPALFEKLNPRAQAYCKAIVADSSRDIKQGIRPNFARLQETWKKGSGKARPY